MSKKDTKRAAETQPETTPTATGADDSTSLPVENRMVSPGMLRVRVVRQPICEDGQHYAKNEEFFVPATRRAALGSLVEDLEIDAKV